MVNYKNAILKTKAFKTVVKDKQSSRLSHTYLLITEDMAYGKEFAKMIAEIMLDIPEGSPAQMRIEKDIHSDVIIHGENEKIPTALASSISTDVFVRPYELDKKVYILLNMNDTNEEAQNKLLKTIEEPPSSVYFILVSKSERKLLRTVLSRAKKLELDLLSKETISKMLEEAGVGQKERNICSACSGGVFARANKMVSDKEFLGMYQNIFNCLYKMNSSRDVLNFASIFSSKNINKEDFADLFMLIVRDLAMVMAGKEDLVNNSHKIDEFKLIGAQFTLEALYKIIEYCLQLKEDLVYNTNINASIDEFLLKVVEVKVKCKR